ncbi:MAG: hypothetical protein RLZZ338_3603 [Cyanobacteriota bacterium]|jgi:glycosyltransferase involved in cell wall biosynthesis
MKIAFISYEYPPDTADGGIATYVYQAAKMLSSRGHHVEVFTGSERRSGMETEEGVIVHRLLGNHRNFIELVGDIFAERHQEVKFDILEGPDCLAESRTAVAKVPDIPLVVKLHTPAILLLKLNYSEPDLQKKIIFFLKSLRHLQIPAWGYNPEFNRHRQHALRLNKIERLHALDADEIVSPSQDLGQKMMAEWGLNPELVTCVPYPYTPLEKLLEIPVNTQTQVVTFIGRLEVRKGVIDFVNAIPLILRHHPQVKFKLVGSVEPSPIPHINMQEYLEQILQSAINSVEFVGGVSPEKIPNILAQTDICVFPSLWENFPCVCLEAMAAGRGIVGSNAGGMLDMLDGGRVGKLVSPRQPQQIADAVCDLLTNPQLRITLGQAAREHLLRTYNAHRISELQEASYQRAIAHRKKMGKRQ